VTYFTGIAKFCNTARWQIRRFILRADGAARELQ
jgi:hypothetical protein